MLKCIVIDDEPLAREGMHSFIKEVEFLDEINAFENAIDASSFIQENQVDLIFLDIQMPKLNGLDFLRSLTNPPLVIITTAFPSFALESFQLDVLDYLVKPITFNRFFKAATKARNQYQLLQKTTSSAEATSDSFFFVKVDQVLEKIIINDIFYIEAMQNYVQIHTTRGKYMALTSMKQLWEYLPEPKFMQVHRSYIVALDKVEAVEGNLLKIQGASIPISRSNREEALERILQGKLIRGGK